MEDTKNSNEKKETLIDITPLNRWLEKEEVRSRREWDNDKAHGRDGGRWFGRLCAIKDVQRQIRALTTEGEA